LATPQQDEPPFSLYHYTSSVGMAGILATMKIYPSTLANNPRDARYGEGQYFSDIAPGSQTSRQLSSVFLRNPFGGARFTNFVQVDLRGIPVIQGRPQYL
jgi:hypothetical protein